MSSLKGALQRSFSSGYKKSRLLSQKALGDVCARMTSFFDSTYLFNCYDIGADDLHYDSHRLKHLVVGNVDRHRQGAFLA